MRYNDVNIACEYFPLLSSDFILYPTSFGNQLYRAEGALTIECQRTDYGPWICECAVECFMGLFEAGNGVVSNIEICYKMV